MKILLTGKNGQLGWELHRQMERDHKVIALGRDDIDFLDSRFLFRMLKTLPKIDLMINATAYTDVDRAEHEPFTAESINSEAAAILASEAERRSIPIIHLSCDYVFDGKNLTRPYRETDRPNTHSIYGWTKLEGEVRIRNISEKHLIFRTSGLYGTRRRNFFTTMLEQNHSDVAPRVVNDQVVSPNWTPLVAEAVTEVIGQLLRGKRFPWGTYHISGHGNGFTTWYEFARLLFEKANQLWNAPLVCPIPVTTEEYGADVKRPKYSVLDQSLFNTTFNFTLPGWYEQLMLCIGGIQNKQTLSKEPNYVQFSKTRRDGHLETSQTR